MSFFRNMISGGNAIDPATLRDMEGKLAAIEKSQASIEFNMDGTIITANQNFLDAMGYRLEEIQERHHRMFVSAAYANSEEYAMFWNTLNRGEFQTAEYERFNKAGDSVWIQASYNPIMDEAGKPYKVIKYASDITAQKKQSIDFTGKINAISRAQAVIEFTPSGEILTANDNFLATVGYSLDEIQGKHHRIFVSSKYADSAEYTDFWKRLGQGEFSAGEYERFGKDGSSVWIQATYNPILNDSGEVVKVVKFATNITEQKKQSIDFIGKLNAISRAQAVIEFTPSGEILTANENFLATVGYSLDEIQGKHHRMFVSPEYGNSADYRDFWRKLGQGEFSSGEYERFGKDGSSIWIQATYNPILNDAGEVVKVVKFATDITEQKKQSIDFTGKMNAISRAQAMIEFTPEGEILTANENFLTTVGYSLHEIQGKHHRMFVSPEYANSMEYREFWKQLAQGEFSAGEYERFGKDGSSVWIQATYNPILDEAGTVVKVVKFATNITEQKLKAVEDKKNAQMASALKLCQASVMLADNDRNIVYLNDEMVKSLSNRERDIQQHLSHFKVSDLIGTTLDTFYSDPADRQTIVNALDKPMQTRLSFDDVKFDLTASSWFDTEGNRIGTVVEWNDRTVEVGAEKEIDAIVEAAAAGDLSRRIDTVGKQGFFLGLAEGLNRLLGIADDVVNDTVRIFDALAHGNLTRKIETDYMGSFGKLKHDANSTVERLTEIMTRIRESSSTVATGASEIAQGNADLSKRTESQASSLEETASSMEEMTSAVKQTSENSVHANELASSAKNKAQEGGEVVDKAVSAMEEINQASKKISDIIGVIDEIAFQTNLLALNAAVEAARAGEQGRGFAVVAGEVRNLAQRSAGAAKEIKDLIRDSVDKVEAGTALVNASGKTLDEIIGAVDRVSAMIQEISTAAAEQSAGIDQVNSAVAQMDEMTQQNAALVEEATAAGEAMAGQAQGMTQLMEFFTVDASFASGTLNEGSVTSVPIVKTEVSPAPSPSAQDMPTGDQGGLSVSNSGDDWEEF